MAARGAGELAPSIQVTETQRGEDSPALVAVSDLEGEAVLAKLLPGLGPNLVDRVFGVIGGGFGACELDHKCAAQIAQLQPSGLQPHILDPGDLRGHFLNSRDGLLLVSVGYSVLPFI